MGVSGGLLAALLAATPIAADGSPPYLGQRQALRAQLLALNNTLLNQDSATAVLQALCDRRTSVAPRIRARKAEVRDDPAQADAVRRQLGVRPGEPIRHRRVELMCGEVVLSRADNWYLPGRLTAQMNSLLQTTERPFGVVVQPLAFKRRTLSTRLLFDPLPADWETAQPELADTPPAIPASVLQHRAVLQTPDGRPFSLLIETYTGQVLTP